MDTKGHKTRIQKGYKISDNKDKNQYITLIDCDLSLLSTFTR